MKRILAIAITIALAFTIMLAFLLSARLEKGISMPSSSKDFEGDNYRNVVNQLLEAGFTNISTAVLDDLVTGWLTKDGEVEKVSANGKTDFNSGSKFSAETKIVVTYHTFPQTKKTNTTFSQPDNEGSKTENYGGITFDIDASWKSEKTDDGRTLYYPGTTDITGFIQCSFHSISIDTITEENSAIRLGYGINGLIRTLNNPEEISRKYFKVGENYAARVCFYFDRTAESIAEYNPNDSRGVIDTVSVLHEDGASILSAIFTTSEYETTYNNVIVKALSSVGIDSSYQHDEIVVTAKPTNNSNDGNFEELDLNAKNDKKSEAESSEEPLTVENNKDLVALFSSDGALCEEFVAKYKGRIIEFDGCIAYMDLHGNYDTRYDLLIYAGDYSEDSNNGSPSMKFNDVNIFDLHLTGNVPEYIGEGENLHIIARVEKLVNGYLIHLKPISVSVR